MGLNELIPKQILNKIKKTDPKPYFKAYVLAHEGTSSPKLLSDKQNRYTFHWSSGIIQAMSSVLKTGIPIFKNHNTDNSTSDRKTIGQLVGNQFTKVKGKLSQVIVAYFPKSQVDNAKDSDIVSLEGNVSYDKNGFNNIVKAIDKITGIAIGNSGDFVPAFSGATEIGQLQMFEPITDTVEPEVVETVQPEIKKVRKQIMEEIEIDQLIKKASLKDTKREIERRRIEPKDIYTTKEIFGDVAFSDGKIDTSNLTPAGKELAKLIDTGYQKRFDEIKENLQKFTEKEAASKNKAIAREHLSKMGIDEAAKRYIEKRIGAPVFDSYKWKGNSVDDNPVIDQFIQDMTGMYEETKKELAELDKIGKPEVKDENINLAPADNADDDWDKL